MKGCTESICSGRSYHRCSECSLRHQEPDGNSVSNRRLWEAPRRLELRLDSAGLFVVRASVLELCSNPQGVSSMNLVYDA